MPVPVAVVFLLLASLASQSHERVGRRFTYCSDSNDFVIEHRDVYLDAAFSEPGLKQYFTHYLDFPGEIYLTASNDDDFIKRLWVTEGGPTLYDIDIREPLHTSGALAYFYKIGRDAFFEYRDEGGKSGWATVAGENLFCRSFSGHTVTLRGFRFVGSWNDKRCLNRRRDLAFVVDSLGDMTVEQILALTAYYDARLPYPISLAIDLTDTLDSAGKGQDMSFKLPPLTLSQDTKRKNVRGVAYLRNDRIRLIRIYDEGKLVYSKEW